MEHHESEQSVLDRLKSMEEENDAMRKLINENNTLLRKVERHLKFSTYLRVAWFLIILGAPFIIYFYVLEPYFSALDSAFAQFSSSIQEVPGWSQVSDQVQNAYDRAFDN